MITVHYVHSSSFHGDINLDPKTAAALVAMNILDWERDENVGNILIKHYRRASAHTL